jgi:hypothetical protein
MDTPDYVAPFAGWKTFSIVGDRRRALVAEPYGDGGESAVWWPGEAHRTPTASGVELLSTTQETLAVVRDIGLGEAGLCVGLVNGWGHITTTGVTLRAELAYPRALWLPFNTRKRSAERKAARVVRRLADYGIPVRAIRVDHWAGAFDQAFLEIQAGENVFPAADVHGVDRFVVEPIIEPVPAGSHARRALPPGRSATVGDHGRSDARAPEGSRWRRPAAE